MTVLVTGGAGYIGGHMVLALLDRGEDVVVVDNLSTGFKWAVPTAAKLVVGDFGDPELISSVMNQLSIDAIAHFAARIVVPESVADPLAYYLNNTSKARNLIECAIGGGVRNFIFSSTAAVYGDTSEMPVDEEAPLRPMSPYGRSKLMVEWMLEDTARATDLRYFVLRYFNVAGADPQGRLGHHTQCDPSDQAGRADRTRPEGVHGNIRRRLPDARWHMRSRLYSGQRPHRCPYRCA
jgi:UDP-glucose 4-epimerase